MEQRYSPEVEARRGDYKQLAESLIQMCAFQSQHVIEILDVEPPGWLLDEPEFNILWFAIQDHMRALFENIARTYNADFMRTLYVELRLFYDQRMLEYSAGAFRGGTEKARRKRKRG